jgi:two-component system phosphate regulon response regulator OmpR
MVVDVMMPGESGLELLRDLRRTSPVPVLMLTAMGETVDRIAGLESGADDYLAKPFEPKELLLRIAAVLKRAPRAAPAAQAIFRLGPYAFDAARGELTREGQSVKLTTGEAHLLKVMAARPGETFTRVALGEAIGIASDRAIDVQVTRLRRKIETDPRNPRILCTVWGEGYVLHPD